MQDKIEHKECLDYRNSKISLIILIGLAEEETAA